MMTKPKAAGRIHVLKLSGFSLSPWPAWLDLSNFPQLLHLDLSGCQLTELPSAVQRAPTLVALTLQNTAISSLPDFLMDRNSLPNLMFLDVRQTNIVSLPIWLATLPRLTQLKAGNSRYLTAHQAVHTTDSASLLRYLRELASHDSVQPLDRFRLMFLGPPGVGKSRTMECMLNERGGRLFGRRLSGRRDPTAYPVIKHHQHHRDVPETKESISFQVMFTDPPGRLRIALAFVTMVFD